MKTLPIKFSIFKLLPKNKRFKTTSLALSSVLLFSTASAETTFLEDFEKGGQESLLIASQDTRAPRAPNTVTATQITHNSLFLSWMNAPENMDVTGYEVYANGRKVRTVGANIHRVKLTNLTPNLTYSFLVRSRDSAGNFSAFSAYETAVTKPRPTSGNVLKISNIRANYFESKTTITWNTNAATTARVTFYANGVRAKQLRTNRFSIKGQLVIPASHLSVNKKYTYNIRVTDRNGKVVQTSNLSFRTTSSGTVRKPKPPVPIKIYNQNRWGAGYAWKPVKGAESYALHSRVKGSVTNIRRSKSYFSCQNDRDVCWTWVNKKMPKGSGIWFVSVKVNGKWSKWSNPKSYTIK